MTHFLIRQRLMTAMALMLMLGLFGAAAAPAAVAQEVEELSGSPVDIHSGTCEEPVLEPAYDAGELGADTLGALADDGYSQVGLLEDETAGAWGVDLGLDGTLTDDEVIGNIDEDVPVAWASADLGEEIDAGQPWAVVVHVDPDAGYGTAVACGSLTGIEPDEEGRYLVPLVPQGEYTAFGYSVLAEGGDRLYTYMFQAGSVAEATPDPAAAGGPYPVDIHSGTCADWTTEPAYDLGDFEVTNIAAEGEQGVGEIDVELPPEAADLGPTYKEGGEGDFTGQDLLDDGPYVVAVHQSSEEYETLVACGSVLQIVEDERMTVLLQPVGENELTGIVTFNTGDSTYTGYLWSCMPLEQVSQPAPTAPPEPTPTPEPTPEPTPTPEPVTVTETEVITVTEVITETEVVPAAEATELAQPGAEIELGAESPGALTSQAGQTLMLNNTSDVERIFVIEELGIEETIPAGEPLEVIFPDDVAPGDYDYQVLEDGEPVFEDILTIE